MKANPNGSGNRFGTLLEGFDRDLLRTLLQRARFDVERGWHAAAIDAIGRALLHLNENPPLATAEPPVNVEFERWCAAGTLPVSIEGLQHVAALVEVRQ